MEPPDHSTGREAGDLRVSATDRTIDRIVDLIGAGELRSGHKLEPEPALASRMGVSRGSLREAVRVLAYLGILDTRVGDGTYVTDLTGARLLQGLDLMGRVATDATTLEIFEIRRSLEATTAMLAAVRASDEQLQALSRQVDLLEAANEYEVYVDHDIRFHDMIAEASGNESLRMLCKSFSTQTQRTRLLRGATVSGVLARSNLEHREILRYLLSRDPQLASAAATAHVAAVEYWLRAQLNHSAYRGAEHYSHTSSRGASLGGPNEE